MNSYPYRCYLDIASPPRAGLRVVPSVSHPGCIVSLSSPPCLPLLRNEWAIECAGLSGLSVNNLGKQDGQPCCRRWWKVRSNCRIHKRREWAINAVLGVSSVLLSVCLSSFSISHYREDGGGCQGEVPYAPWDGQLLLDPERQAARKSGLRQG